MVSNIVGVTAMVSVNFLFLCEEGMRILLLDEIPNSSFCMGVHDGGMVGTQCHYHLTTNIQITYKCASVCFSTGIVNFLGPLLEAVHIIVYLLKTYHSPSYLLRHHDRS